jgi:hypothetical protein
MRWPSHKLKFNYVLALKIDIRQAAFGPTLRISFGTILAKTALQSGLAIFSVISESFREEGHDR